MKMLKPYTTLIIALSGHLLGFGQPYFLQWQTNSINVAFADEGLSDSLKESIVADLSLCFQGWAANAEIMLREKGESAGYMDYGTHNPYYRDGVVFPKNIITNSSGGIALQIPKTLSDTYTNAFAFAAANSNIVAAAYEFVAFVSSTNFPGMSSNALPDYIMFKNALPDANAESNAIVNLAPQIIPDVCGQTYYPPSILGFTYSSDGPAATNLWMQVPNSSPSAGGGKDWGKTTVLWHENKWRFCVWLDWVP